MIKNLGLFLLCFNLKTVALACGNDFNKNGVINSQDTVLFRNYLATQNLRGDINGNGSVNAQDTVLFRNSIGTQPICAPENYNFTGEVRDINYFPNPPEQYSGNGSESEIKSCSINGKSLSLAIEVNSLKINTTLSNYTGPKIYNMAITTGNKIEVEILGHDYYYNWYADLYISNDPEFTPVNCFLDVKTQSYGVITGRGYCKNLVGVASAGNYFATFNFNFTCNLD
jgi:Dockerin type I domain